MLERDGGGGAECVLDFGDGVGVTHEFEDLVVGCLGVDGGSVANIADGLAVAKEVAARLYLDARCRRALQGC